MRMALFINNRLGLAVADYLAQRHEDIVALILHPPHKRKHGQTIAQTLGFDADNALPGDQLNDPDIAKRLADAGADIGVSILFDYILKPDTIARFPQGVINLHPSLLPFNRGQYPNVWSIVEGTPSGVTLHYIDEGIDTGDIIAQHRVEVAPVDTGATLYEKLEHAGLEVFKANWPKIVAGQAPRSPQGDAVGTYHRTRDVDAIDRIDLDRSYPARELINILRARTFPPYAGAWFEEGGRRVNVRIELEYAKDAPDA